MFEARRVGWKSGEGRDGSCGKEGGVVRRGRCKEGGW